MGSHPLARRRPYDARGLSIRKALSLLRIRVAFSVGLARVNVASVRLSDRDTATPQALLKRLHSMPSTALATILATGASRDQQIEFVSNCAPWDACVEALRQGISEYCCMYSWSLTRMSRDLPWRFPTMSDAA